MDLSRIPPRGLHLILKAVSQIAQHERTRIIEDIADYPPGETKDQMQGWADAYRELDESCNPIRYGK